MNAAANQSAQKILPLPIVGVIGSGRDRHEPLSRGLGQRLAELGVHLITGGGGGVMDAVSQAFYNTQPRKGRVIGILPSLEGDPLHRPKPGYPNPWVEISIATHLPLSGAQGSEALSRNHIIVLSSHAVLALPGGAGTESEMQCALRYRRPLMTYGVAVKTRQPLTGMASASSLGEIERFLTGLMHLKS